MPKTEKSQSGSHRTLEIDDDPALQDRIWRGQRIGWVLLGLFLVAALLGFTGSGPLADAEVSSSDNQLTARYHRFNRQELRAELLLDVAGPQSEAGRVQLGVSHSLAESFDSAGSYPMPVETKGDAEWVWYSFQAAMPGQPVRIRFQMRPIQIGLLSGQVRLPQGSAVTIRQWVHP